MLFDTDIHAILRNHFSEVLEMEEIESTEKVSAGMDMLHGSLFKKLLLFAFPLAASSILQQLFNAVDVAVVGQFASSQEQAAVGCNGPVINLLINLFVGISVGTNVAIANYIGQQHKERIHAAVHTSMVTAIASGLLLLVLGLFTARPILLWMDTPAEVLDYAVTYLKIYFWGMPFIMVYNFGAAILRSMGDTKRPLYCLVVSGTLNAALNLFLVIAFHLGAAGVAIATVISNVVSAGMVWHFLSHEAEPIRLSARSLAVSRPELLRILQIGIPAGIQGMVFSVANVFVQTALNGLGTSAVAGSAVALNYEYFTYFIVSAFNQAAVTFTSQNYGAKAFDRCRQIFRLCMVVGMLATGVLSLVFVLGRGFFASLFSPDPAVIEYAKLRMLHILTLNFICATYEIGGAALRGIGYSMTPALITIFGTCVFRIWWIHAVFPRFSTFETLMDVYPITWILTGAAVLAAYFFIRRRVFSGRLPLR